MTHTRFAEVLFQFVSQHTAPACVNATARACVRVTEYVVAVSAVRALATTFTIVAAAVVAVAAHDAWGQDRAAPAAPAGVDAANAAASTSESSAVSTKASDAAADTAVDAIDETVQRGIKYLMSKQRADGAIVEHQNETTMTSLAIMAMASAGASTAENSLRGEAMRKALNFVLTGDRQDKDGYFGNRDGSRMYGHGVTTLMLTEMIGMGADAQQDALIHDRCQKAINLILSAQKQSKRVQDRGGWRYTPNSNDSDLSVSVWQVMALRSAKNDGLEVPAESIQQAVDYLKRSYTSRLDSRGVPIGGPAGFSYIPDQNNPTYTMTAAGLLAMQVCGEYESPLVAGAADWLLAHPPQWNERFFFYGTYYYAQGMYQRGGEHAETADRLVRQMLLDRQQPDGSWTAPSGEEGGAGKVYSTSLALLSLSVKYHYLPIYQK